MDGLRFLTDRFYMATLRLPFMPLDVLNLLIAGAFLAVWAMIGVFTLRPPAAPAWPSALRRYGDTGPGDRPQVGVPRPPIAVVRAEPAVAVVRAEQPVAEDYVGPVVRRLPSREPPRTRAA